ncbi:MAG: zinc ribbon domain-containing protein [Coriobacteriia bacterium]
MGYHAPLVSSELFGAFGTKNKRSYVLRDFLYCAECGAKITAGTHKGLTYYRRTHAKGACAQRSYIREEQLIAEVSELLARIEIGEEIIAALVEEARICEQTKRSSAARDVRPSRGGCRSTAPDRPQCSTPRSMA